MKSALLQTLQGSLLLGWIIKDLYIRNDNTRERKRFLATGIVLIPTMQLSQNISSFEKEDLLLFLNLILNTLEQPFQISLNGVFEFIAESDGEHKRMQSMHIFPSQ